MVTTLSVAVALLLAAAATPTATPNVVAVQLQWERVRLLDLPEGVDRTCSGIMASPGSGFSRHGHGREGGRQQ